MKVSVLAHCSHNKGDNSVLSFINNMFDDDNSIKSVHVSTSSGEKPFWFSGDAVASFWGCGPRFPKKDESVINKFLRVVRNRFLDKLYYLALYLYAKDMDVMLKVLLDLILNNDFKKQIDTSDIVICTGGHHISSVLDKDGVNSQLVDMIYSVVSNKSLYLWAQSIGPVETDKDFVIKGIGKLLESSSFICYRDEDSRQFIESLNVETNKKLVDDSVFGLRSKIMLQIPGKEIGTNIKKKAVIAVYTAGKLKNNTLSKYKEILTETIDHLLNLDYVVELLPMQYKGLQDDERPFLYELKQSASNSSSVSVLVEDMSPTDTLNYLKDIDILIGHKTHSVVYGLALAIPTIAISYHPKTTFFMSRFNMSDYVIDDKFLSSELVIEKIDAAMKNADLIKNTIKDSSNHIGANVIESFNEMIERS
ncbi:polysaccharide pyruvyl transferase family protein [Vibrio fluvialis]|uniref:polysaccharide pyruvyl transferase family protein n=1 Tax=Vibrio fluvialis TaxID=676 RepID=UPI0005C8AFFA|nr:polysaccharide pyruvyl transferase family protein [Vibrio fluvialis]